ncbi:PLP-dependent transferase [Aureobasidium sp. EXF-10727]|nr:PLP-dependent transferase [Aureobasidium sp. EXF-10727]
METGATAAPDHVLPTLSEISQALNDLHKRLPPRGLGSEAAKQHLKQDVAPALNANSQSSRYYGFVTGGATPAAIFADNMVTEYDQNVQVHLPEETIATDVEAAALDMVCELVQLDSTVWRHKTFTTGATASNILGLACAREHIIKTAAARRGVTAEVSSRGIFGAMRAAGIDDIRILTTAPHSSLKKAASILGLGHASVVNVCEHEKNNPHTFDMARLEEALQTGGTNIATIISVSCSEVNSGIFATDENLMSRLRALADRHSAWLHVDAAFGLLARILPSKPEYTYLKNGAGGLHLADSIAADAHKLLNVPYDCGIFFSKHLETATAVFQNPGAPYLNAPDGTVPSPLNIGIENSRRFRALPVYANLVAYGRQGFVEMLERQIELAREIAAYIDASNAYQLLPSRYHEKGFNEQTIFIIVLFKAVDPNLNAELKQKINATRKIYVSGTSWQDDLACRFAISNWRSSVQQDLESIEKVLDDVAASSVN